jgi:NADH-quinone oxidoreductase subunit B
VIRSYLPALVFVGLGSLIGLVFAVANTYLGPKRRSQKAQGDPYECGLPSQVQKNFRFGISFYLVAMLFILFDIEVIFLFPVAIQLKAFGTFALVETIVFMEIKREALGAGSAGDFRARQLRARDMLRGELEGEELEKHVEQSVLTTTLDKAASWAIGNANFPLSFGLACCAIEWMSHIGARVDVARFGFEAARASPRQADTIFLSGRVSIKMAPVIRRLYDQMLEPRYVIAMGACSSSMGVFNNYAIVPGDKFLPVDVHVPGCPPRPEALVHGILKLRAAILSQPDEGWRTRYGGRGTEEVVSDDELVNVINVPGGGRTGTSA